MTDTYNPNAGDRQPFSDEWCRIALHEDLVQLLRHCPGEIDEASWEAIFADKPHDPHNLLGRLANAISGVRDEIIPVSEAAIAAYYAAHPDETK